MNIKKGFTLAEVLITLTIIGVVAAISIPSVSSAYTQKHYKTGLKKAVKTINESISLNIAKGNGSALRTGNLFEYLQQNMEVISSTTNNVVGNSVFYTADGAAFEFSNADDAKKGSCGTSGLGIGGSDSAQAQGPCLITVDINGNKRPNKLSSNNEIFDRIQLMITDKTAIPFGEAAQAAFYGN